MATNYVQPGKTLTLVAPYDCTPGHGALVGSVFGVSLGTVLSAASGEFAIAGVFSLAKTSAQAWTLGQRIYWDNTNHRCDSDPNVGMLIGVASAVAANPSSVGSVRLNGTTPVSSTANYGVTTQAVDGAIAIAPGIVRLTKGSAAAMTLAAPTAAQEGTELIITAGSAYAHVVTATGLYEDGVTGGSKTTATFGAFAGATITLRAVNLKWTVVSKNVVTIS
jgi:predicted RecA/RadA family phage recombinase